MSELKQRWKHFKTLSRSAQAIILLRFLLVGVVAYAAISMLVNAFWTSNWTKKGFVEIEIDVGDRNGAVGPGDTMSVNPTLMNTGNDDALAFIKFTYPTFPGSTNPGMSGSAYTWTVGSGWSVIEQGIGYTVYGYDSALAENETTGELMSSVTMKDMSGAEYKAIDVNIRFDGWLADCNEYGTELGSAWSRIGE